MRKRKAETKRERESESEREIAAQLMHEGMQTMVCWCAGAENAKIISMAAAPYKTKLTCWAGSEAHVIYWNEIRRGTLGLFSRLWKSTSILEKERMSCVHCLHNYFNNLTQPAMICCTLLYRTGPMIIKSQFAVVVLTSCLWWDSP